MRRYWRQYPNSSHGHRGYLGGLLFVKIDKTMMGTGSSVFSMLPDEENIVRSAPALKIKK